MAQTVDLYVWPGMAGLSSYSPFCLKVILAFRFKKVAFRTVNMTTGAPSWARRGLLPVAVINGKKIEDSTSILKALDLHVPAGPRLYPFGRPQRVDTQLLEDWADERLSTLFMFERWVVKKNYQNFIAPILKHAPRIIGPLIASRIRKEMVEHVESRDLGLFNEEERRAVWIDTFSVIEEKLSGRPFLTGNEPTAADFAVYPYLKIMISLEMQPIAQQIQEKEAFLAWMKRIEDLTVGAPS